MAQKAPIEKKAAPAKNEKKQPEKKPTPSKKVEPAKAAAQQKSTGKTDKSASSKAIEQVSKSAPAKKTTQVTAKVVVDPKKPATAKKAEPPKKTAPAKKEVLVTAKVVVDPKKQEPAKKAEPPKKAAPAKKETPVTAKVVVDPKKQPPAKKAEPPKKTAPAKKEAPITAKVVVDPKKQPPAKKAEPQKKAAPAKKEAPVTAKVVVDPKKQAPAKEAEPAKKAAPAKKEAPVTAKVVVDPKKPEPEKKAEPAKKAAPAKKDALPVESKTTPKEAEPVKKSVPEKVKTADAKPKAEPEKIIEPEIKPEPMKQAEPEEKKAPAKKSAEKKAEPEMDEMQDELASQEDKDELPEMPVFVEKFYECPLTNLKESYPRMLDKRLSQLYYSMEDNKVEAVVLTYLPNIRYLTNFSGSAATLFILNEAIYFVTDDRYEEQIKSELFPLPNLKAFICRNPWQFLKDSGLLDHISTLGFEADHMAYSEAVDYRNQIRPIKFKPTEKVFEPFTQPKAPEELAYIQQACDIATQVYEKVLEFIKPGMTEKELANEISYIGRQLGSEGDAFDVIAVSGPRSALVHGQPSDRKIKKNDVVLIDFGCIVNGFRSDITRTFVLGKATKDQKTLYQLLYDAKQAAIEAVRPGLNGRTLDAVARDMIKNAGFGDYFKHSLGHGIGIVTHEGPIITFRRDDQIIPEDSVVAIEPGVYLPERYGMRVEDCLLVTRNGGKQLSFAPDELLQI